MRDWRSLWASVGVPEQPFTPEGRLGVKGLMALACVSLATIEVVDPPQHVERGCAGMSLMIAVVERVERGDADPDEPVV